jgi:hypothetical protein
LPRGAIERRIVTGGSRLFEIYVDEYLAGTGCREAIDDIGQARAQLGIVLLAEIAWRTDEDDFARSLMLQRARGRSPEEAVRRPEDTENPYKRGNRESDPQMLRAVHRQEGLLASH